MTSKKKGQGTGLRSLLELTERHQALLTHFLQKVTDNSATLSASNQDKSSLKDSPNPLSILHDASSLLKAHTTKLSLLIINKPFTPSAISGELKKVVEECVVCMISAVEIMGTAPTETSNAKKGTTKDETLASMDGNIWGDMMLNEARSRVARVVREVSVLIGEVQSIAECESGAIAMKSAPVLSANRDTLSSTGVVWEACELLIELQKVGLAGLAIQKAQQYHETLMDAIAELKEWGEETEEEEEEGIENDDDDDELKDLFGSVKRLPKGDVVLGMQLASTVKRLKSIGVLYQALLKRRLKTLNMDVKDANSLTQVKRLDKLISTLQIIPETVDDLAAAFYDLNGREASKLLGNCIQYAISGAELMKRNWNDEEDEFTTWCTKWNQAVAS